MSRMRTIGRIAVVVSSAVASSLCGCAQNPFFGTPRFLEPAGSAEYQQTRAQRFDPYPDTNIGPKVDGSRPEGFDAPPPEPARGRPNQWNSAPSYGS
jgi:hypothetical protein